MFSFKLIASFVINCCYTHICIPKYINTTCSVYTVLLECMFSFGISWSVGVLFPAEDDFSCARHSLVACSFLCSWWRVKASWSFPISFSCPLASFLSSSYLGSHLGKTLWVCLLTALGSTTSQQIPWSSGSYNVSAPSSSMFLEPFFFFHKEFKVYGILEFGKGMPLYTRSIYNSLKHKSFASEHHSEHHSLHVLFTSALPLWLVFLTDIC